MSVLASGLSQLLRQLRRAPGLFALVVITLTLGIGATTAMFGVVDMMLLRPLPYPNAARLAEVNLRIAGPAGRSRISPRTPSSPCAITPRRGLPTSRRIRWAPA